LDRCTFQGEPSRFNRVLAAYSEWSIFGWVLSKVTMVQIETTEKRGAQKVEAKIRATTGTPITLVFPWQEVNFGK
jgi:hypothetical protein